MVRTRMREGTMLNRVAGTTAALVVVLALVPATPSPAALGDCGQPASTGAAPVATDALFTLAVAVGTRACEPCVCDIDDSGEITASDALRILRVSVGQPQPLDCPGCGPASCNDTQAPECGGVCSDGRTCAPAPDEPGACRCQDPCQASGAPTCGGSCDHTGDANLTCRLVTIEAQGAPPAELCECLPIDLQICGDAEAPACNGACPPAALCQDGGLGACECAPLPRQGPCEEAASPECLGTCGAGTICEPDDAGACTCAAFTGQEEGCAAAEAPVCGGTCASGASCALNFDFTCACVSPCDLSDAPTCGGECLDESQTCVPASGSLGGGSIEFCSCR